MRVVFIASEAAPFAKTGGLADVVGALPKALADLGHEVALLLPFYRSVRQARPPVSDTRIQVEVEMPSRPVPAEVHRTVLPESAVPVYLIRNDEYFDREHLYGAPTHDYEDNCERFAFFSRAALKALRALDLRPEVIHAHDWQTGLVPALAQVRHAEDESVARAAHVLTLHNLSYQGLFWHWDMPLTGLPWEMFNWRELEFHGRVNLLKAGIVFADLITTVSPRYAKEIQTPAFGCGLDGLLQERSADLVGVLNGVDYGVWDPSVDPRIPVRYSADRLEGKAACKRALQEAEGLPPAAVPLVGMISRLVPQKGFDLVADAIGEMMELDLQFVLLGTGEQVYQELMAEVARRFPEKARAHITFDDGLAHRIEAAADIFLMPSQFEPCGLNQLYSLRYGAVPVVHETGGLADSVVNLTAETLVAGRATGFVFSRYTSGAMLEALGEAVDLYQRSPGIWRQLQLTGMRQDFSWTASARRYADLYEAAVERARCRPPRGARSAP